ncbi:hypothetical protein AJ80_00912 [Polytolypa hystricis UAMH7299]|uniref:rhamnogalacturonan endolyase n=1 Tax=Polytolypa hystricis (strain UAMH7299) TaxID=1447883 RepID=A0A2B7YTR2_POLH7|nr:hypothetical protein AJ80_00912 [Polytolypa hystricis UAMH7299]
MRLGYIASLVALWAKATEAAFGYTTSSSSYTIDAGSANPLVFDVSRSTCDITSILYRGTQLQYSSQSSHIGSGLGSASVSITQTGDYIKVTCQTSSLIHYYVVRNGDSTVFMATHITAKPSVGELRYIARLSSSLLPDEIPFGVVSNTAGSSSTVEGSDVFVVNGQTRSKFYSSQRFIDDQVHCISGDDRRVCMVIPNPNSYESSSGGPFFRDINTNNGGSYNALYFYMNSGHAQTEPYRMGLHGPYAMVFSRSGSPAGNLDTTFFESLGIQGYVPRSQRGYVSGRASGPVSGYPWVVHWYNSNAQYWAYTDSSGSFSSPPMKPGQYTMKLYQNEFPVATESVSVSTGSTVTKDISGSVVTGNTIWRIGEWDGTPNGFRNAENQLRMHPSDSRMASWGPLTYTVGSSPLTDFPMAVFKSVNNPVTIRFNLDSSQTGAATLRVGTTLSFAGARPQVTVNSWTSSVPPAPTNLNSRGVTRGAYRGYGEVYDFNIPSGTLVSGSNTVRSLPPNSPRI